jgi:hypothetical protein
MPPRPDDLIDGVRDRTYDEDGSLGSFLKTVGFILAIHLLLASC